MSAKEQVEEPTEEPSRAAGACVLVVLAGVVTAVVFAISPTAGVLSAWMVGALALWRSARRMSDSSATPPPRGVALDSGVNAGRRLVKARAVYDPNGVMCITHPSSEQEKEAERQRLQDHVNRACAEREAAFEEHLDDALNVVQEEVNKT